MARKLLLGLLVPFVMIVAACAGRRGAMYHGRGLPEPISMYVAMPSNIVVFEHLGPVLYTALWNQIKRMGYRVAAVPEKADFQVLTTIKKLETPMQFMSPDLLPYTFSVRVEVECVLKDRGGVELFRHDFVESQWISRAQDAVLNRAFAQHQYRTLLERLAPRIEHQVRVRCLAALNHGRA